MLETPSGRRVRTFGTSKLWPKLNKASEQRYYDSSETPMHKTRNLLEQVTHDCEHNIEQKRYPSEQQRQHVLNQQFWVKQLEKTPGWKTLCLEYWRGYSKHGQLKTKANYPTSLRANPYDMSTRVANYAAAGLELKRQLSTLLADFRDNGYTGPQLQIFVQGRKEWFSLVA